MTLFVIILFFLLTPGVLVSLPFHGSLYMKAMVHAVLFALIYHFTHKMVWNMFYGDAEGFFACKDGKDEKGKSCGK
jgi:hypothetical protein